MLRAARLLFGRPARPRWRAREITRRQRGLVKWFSRAKGYGFITPITGPEVFLHKSGLAVDQALPSAGQLVEFSLGHGSRGAQAENVVILAPDGGVPPPEEDRGLQTPA